jgi:Uma2 family endonuclease
VFEILSPSNDANEMERKLEFYDTYGVEECYLYNPENFQLAGWLRQEGHLSKRWQMDGWVSPRLGIRFVTGQGELLIYRPDGQQFLTLVEMEQRAEQERQRAEQLAAYLRSIGVDPDHLPEQP